MFKHVLILGAHPDDAEFSSGGTIRKLTEAGSTVWYAAFSPCNKSLPEGFAKDALFDEMKIAAGHLGIREEHILQYPFPVRELPKYRQEILEEMILLRNKINPDLVLIPNANDLHQDHRQVHLEGVRAFKFTRILGYEFPWNNFHPVTNVHVRLEQDHIDAKWQSIQEYKTQYRRSYSDEQMVYGLARVRGRQCGAPYAEGFEAIRWLL